MLGIIILAVLHTNTLQPAATVHYENIDLDRQ